jgi:hypothetical protein
VSPRKRYTFWIDEHHVAALDTIQQRDGVLPSEQIRRALEAWFVHRGLKPKPERKRPASRKRS